MLYILLTYFIYLAQHFGLISEVLSWLVTSHRFEKISFLSHVFIICNRLNIEKLDRNGFKTLLALICRLDFYLSSILCDAPRLAIFSFPNIYSSVAWKYHVIMIPVLKLDYSYWSRINLLSFCNQDWTSFIFVRFPLF